MMFTAEILSAKNAYLSCSSHRLLPVRANAFSLPPKFHREYLQCHFKSASGALPLDEPTALRLMARTHSGGEVASESDMASNQRIPHPVR